MTDGLVGAIEGAAGRPIGTSMLPDPVQLEAFRGADGRVTAEAIRVVRGRGRPAGARNKRTKKDADYFVQRYGDPLDVLGQMMTTPLRQFVEVLREADNADEREAHLLQLAETIDAQVSKLVAKGSLTKAESQTLERLVDRLADVAKVLRATPGKLALDALALQLQATFRALEYVHGKQPVSLEVTSKADLVIFAPEILKNFGIDPDALQAATVELPACARASDAVSARAAASAHVAHAMRRRRLLISRPAHAVGRANRIVRLDRPGNPYPCPSCLG